MQRITTSTRSQDLFGSGKDGFTDGNTTSGLASTSLNADWFNGIQEEIANVIEASGIDLSASELTQLLQAIAIGGRGLFNSASAGGTADAITASYTPSITSLFHGMRLFVRAAYANATTTPTFTPNSGVISAKTIIKDSGAALNAGDIAGAGNWIEIQYDQTLDKWVLLNPSSHGLLRAANNLSDLGSVATALTNLGFSYGTGYVKLPTGHYIERLSITSLETAGVNFTFPHAFTATPSVAITDAGSTCYSWGYSSLSTSGITVYARSITNSGALVTGAATLIAFGL